MIFLKISLYSAAKIEFPREGEGSSIVCHIPCTFWEIKLQKKSMSRILKIKRLAKTRPLSWRKWCINPLISETLLAIFITSRQNWYLGLYFNVSARPINISSPKDGMIALQSDQNWRLHQGMIVPSKKYSRWALWPFVFSECTRRAFPRGSDTGYIA